jgi:hypothetical protein
MILTTEPRLVVSWFHNLDLQKCQRTKASLILYAPKNLYHGNLRPLGQNELKRATGITL